MKKLAYLGGMTVLATSFLTGCGTDYFNHSATYYSEEPVARVHHHAHLKKVSMEQQEVVVHKPTHHQSKTVKKTHHTNNVPNAAPTVSQ